MNRILKSLSFLGFALCCFWIHGSPSVVITGNTILSGNIKIPSLSSGGGSGPITNGLLAWWKYDDGSGSTALDSSGNGETGTLVNTPTWISGKINGALAFNTTSTQYMDSFNFADNLANFSTTCWVNFSSTAITRAVVAKMGAGGFSSGNGWGIYLSGLGGSSTGGVLALAQGSSGSVFIQQTSTNSIADSQWHSVIMTLAGTNLLLYVDGTNTGAFTHSGVMGSFSNGNNVRVADDYQNSTTVSVDDVRLYNRVLSSIEVSNIFTYPGVY